MSSLVPAKVWAHAFRRSSKTRPLATTIHPSVAADKGGHGPESAYFVQGLGSTARFVNAIASNIEHCRRGASCFINLVTPDFVFRHTGAVRFVDEAALDVVNGHRRIHVLIDFLAVESFITHGGNLQGTVRRAGLG